MSKSPISISIVVPFFWGNEYLCRLFASIESVVEKTQEKALFEVIIVNDSPQCEVKLPRKKELDITVINNKVNLGIQRARIKGLSYANYEWILFLDQDDEIIADGFMQQIQLTDSADVVVGNGRYILGTRNKQIFQNKKIMNYLIQRNKFIHIRNLITSPGECLIRKSVIPQVWKENHLQVNGADDWMLWLCLFSEKARFVCNELLVYRHNDTEGENLSADISKMTQSACEMNRILYAKEILSHRESHLLKNAIEFKYFQDTKQLTILKCILYSKQIWDNVVYKVRGSFLARM